MRSKVEADFRVMSQAVLAWYRYYEIDPEVPPSIVLCTAALDLYKDGYRSVDEIANMLIGIYVGVYSTRVNAPSSVAVH
ncbi:hypothetical protein [Rhizobium tubonense]|uniref:Uncharacterized protein n=1 Tax=Rhizobium tubonense TaxID=484088 RepID=A0A2W4DJS1_9HYPH|nr:hypothetical protein [Rhizobium tubonense]PZM16444.1 hypothetical protein CPY51_03655 [Rhizobium tubonense]